MKKSGFTLIELIGIVVIIGLILLVAVPTINDVIERSEENKKQEALNNIYMATENYLMANYDEYSSLDNIGASEYIYVMDLINQQYMDIDELNPNDDEYFDSKDVVKVTKKQDGTFSYELIVAQTIYDVVINNFPYLEVGENGCKNPGDNNYSYMGGCYLKGNPTNNYIWYSGFLWRIMGINADGTVRLITDENVTAIPWGAENTAENWDDSYIKDWLTSYFYPRLKDNEIISEQTWCSDTTTDANSSRTTCSNDLLTKDSKVGLISLDEYNLAGGINSYLNIKISQYFMTPYSSSSLWYAIASGNYTDSRIASGLRPVINIYFEIIVTSGTGNIGENWSDEDGPYILNEDKNIELSGKLNEKATSGEYVLFSGKKYRVVDKDSNGNTKLILDDYYNEDGNVFEMKYNESNSNVFSTTTGIGQKLNGDVLEWLVSSSKTEDRNKLVTNYTWYQNNFDFYNSYKISLDELTPTKTIQATVGLIRVGEMLSGQSASILTKNFTTKSDVNNGKTFWTITKFNNDFSSFIVNSGANLNYNRDVDEVYSLRPVIVIKSDVEIISGTGTFSNPYQI